jgi:hypothetical protein
LIRLAVRSEILMFNMIAMYHIMTLNCDIYYSGDLTMSHDIKMNEIRILCHQNNNKKNREIKNIYL